VEWSSWVRVAYGVASATTAPRRRVSSPSAMHSADDRTQGWEVALGADLTLGVGRGGALRLGPWIEARSSSDAVAGVELVLSAAPAALDMFWYRGEGVLIARAGLSRTVRTAALSYGYRAPWNLYRTARGRTRYMIGARMVASVTQSLDDGEQWSATVGIETEPVGALRYLLGIRSWY
jgi:hypothetical protein